MSLPATLRALRYPHFQLFFAGQFVSLIGTWMQSVAQSWLVYRLTGSSVLLGAVAFSGQIPVFLCAPLGGIAADRFNRRHVVIATQAASMMLAAALAALTLSGTVKIWHIFVLSAMLGAVNSFDIPARQSLIADMVERADLINAIALNSSMFNASRVIGPAVAGILVASIGEGWCFFANAVSYVAVIAGLLIMKVPVRVRDMQTGSPLSGIAEGFGFVFANRPVHGLLILLGVVSITGMPYVVLMPIFADRILHGGAEALGWLMGATGVGAMCGALLLASRQTLRGLGSWVPASAFGFGTALLAFSFSRSFWLSTVILVPVGFSIMLEMGASNTLIQSMTPDRLRGRVMAVYSMMFMGMAPVGSLLAGAAADRFGAPATVAAAGMVCCAAAVVCRILLPQVRGPAWKLIGAQQAAAEPVAPAAYGGVHEPQPGRTSSPSSI
jgi:MFS family permease